MKANQYLDQAKAAIERAKQMIANNEFTVEEFEIKLGGPSHAYSDSASHNPKPFSGGYTQNHGGVVSAKVNAEFYLKDAWAKLWDLRGKPWDLSADAALISEACDYLEEQAKAEFGFEL